MIIIVRIGYLMIEESLKYSVFFIFNNILDVII